MVACMPWNVQGRMLNASVTPHEPLPVKAASSPLFPAPPPAPPLQGRALYVKLGDKEVEYNAAFRLILHTKLSA